MYTGVKSEGGLCGLTGRRLNRDNIFKMDDNDLLELATDIVTTLSV